MTNKNFTLFEFLCSEAVVARDSHTHVDRSYDIECILNNEKYDCTDIYTFTAVIGTVYFTLRALKWWLLIKDPVGAKYNYYHIDCQCYIEQYLHNNNMKSEDPIKILSSNQTSLVYPSLPLCQNIIYRYTHTYMYNTVWIYSLYCHHALKLYVYTSKVNS